MSGELHIGDVLGGKYRIDELIGQGGMGLVARATQLDLGRTVAVKSLRPEVRGHAEVVERFYREARAASRIGGAHAVQILDVGRTDAGDPYMVMELLEGEDLDRVIRRDGRQPLAVAVQLMVQACSGVADAHRVRIVHRDLKPSNLFLARQASGAKVLKVLDFGISRLDDQASQLTRTTTQLGTPHYMSPEQIERPKSVDHRTDIWALGCIFHKLLVGETPFRGQGMQLISAVVRNTRKRPSEILPELGPEVDAVVDACLEPSTDRRIQSAEALADALQALVPGGPPSRPHLLNLGPARSQRASDRPPSSIRTDAGVSVSSLVAATPMPQSDSEAHTSIDLPLEQTLALDPGRVSSVPLARTPASAALMRTQLMAPRAPTSAPELETPPPPSNPRISHLPSQAPRPSHVALRPARRRSRTPMFVGIGVISVMGALALVGTPRVAGSRARAAAARAGVTLTYRSARPALSGWELTDVVATFADAPSSTISAKHAHYSMAMDDLTLDDVELSLGNDGAALGRALDALQKEDLRRIEARNVHFLAGNGTVTMDGNNARFLVTKVDVPQADVSSGGDHFSFELESKSINVTSFGVTLEGVGGKVEGNRSRGTVTATAPADSPTGLTVQGSYDHAGVYLSARMPRQKVAEEKLQLATFDHKSGPDHEVELMLDLRSTADEVKAEIDFTVFGLGTTVVSRVDLSAHVSVHGRPDSLVVERGTMRMGPFPLVQTGTATMEPALHVVLAGDDTPISCNELKMAKQAQLPAAGGITLTDLSPYVGELGSSGTMDVKAGVDATFAGTPRVTITLPTAETCGLPIFPAQ